MELNSNIYQFFDVAVKFINFCLLKGWRTFDLQSVLKIALITMSKIHNKSLSSDAKRSTLSKLWMKRGKIMLHYIQHKNILFMYNCDCVYW